MEFKTEVSNWFKNLQDNICLALENADGKATFQEDLWQRPEGGGGRTRVIQNGNVFEKGGVNFSAVHGNLPQNIAKALKLDATNFFATGVSIVIHPKNPFVPIIHVNVRYFEVDDNVYWFGGGIDLTPIYVFEEDGKFFHNEMKKVCDKHHADYYTKFKKWADDYFYIKHRNEMRGIGGIFFDRLDDENGNFTKQQRWNFVKDVGNAFAPTYVEIVNKHAHKSYTEENIKWQMIRRSRYVEFNLIYDKGTKFGLDTGGRIESILMSMPPQAEWYYNYDPETASKEAKNLAYYQKEVEWV